MNSEHNIVVSNNRIIIPKEYVDELGKKVIYYYDISTNSIRIYNYDVLAKRLDKVLEMNLDRRILRSIFSNLNDANITNNNRLTLDFKTLKRASISNEATIIHSDDHLKLCKKRVKLS